MSNGQQTINYPSLKASNYIFSDINIDLLCQHWIHSREEQQTDQEQIYRPTGFKEFPPSRFRMEYIFNKNGDCEWYYLSPDDGHKFKSGKWKVDPNNKNIIQIIKDGVTESYQIQELTKDKLQMTLVKPKKRHKTS